MNRSAFILFVIVMSLLVIGAMMVYDTTSAEILLKEQTGIHKSLLKHVLSALVGGLFYLTFYRIGYKKLVEYAPYFYVGLLILLLLVFVPHIGMQINGARRWLNLGLSFQPSEFSKLILPPFFVWMYEKYGSERTFMRFFKMQIALAIALFLILIEPDNGTVAIMTLSMATLYFIMRIRPLYWGVPLAIMLVGTGLLASQMKHVPDRIRIYLNPELDLLGKGHQPYQAKIATGSGGLFGRGLGESLQKLNYLPEARSDYIAAIYAEEFGYVGILVLIFLYMSFAVIGFSIAARANDERGYLLATASTFIISIQAFLNMGVVSGLLPSKGVNLPFFSHGGSSLAVNFAMVAILAHVANTAQRCENSFKTQGENCNSSDRV